MGGYALEPGLLASDDGAALGRAQPILGNLRLAEPRRVAAGCSGEVRIIERNGQRQAEIGDCRGIAVHDQGDGGVRASR